MYSHKNIGTCSTEVVFDVKEGKLTNVQFFNGCEGNLISLSRLVEGMKVEEAIDKLLGIQCQNGTSCGDQFAQALLEYMEKEKSNGHRRSESIG